MSRVNDVELERFWEYFFRFHRADIESSRNKLSSFLLSPFIKPMFDSVGSTIDFYQTFKSGKVILVNLSRNFFKDDSSRGFLGAVIFSMVYNALLQRENDQERRPVVMLCDEIHEYFIPDFVLPILTGGRKYGAGLKMFTQSLGHFKPHDLEIIFSTIGSIVAFAVGSADAKRLVDELFSFRNDEIVKQYQKRDIYGGYGEKTYYSAGEQRQHALAELMEQHQREVLVRIKKRHGNETYIGRVADVPEFKVSSEEEAEYRRGSARHHGYQNP
jgi:type IV secretory pathway TraG/TraD family ATPase VirD4